VTADEPVMLGENYVSFELPSPRPLRPWLVPRGCSPLRDCMSQIRTPRGESDTHACLALECEHPQRGQSSVMTGFRSSRYELIRPPSRACWNCTTGGVTLIVSQETTNQLNNWHSTTISTSLEETNVKGRGKIFSQFRTQTLASSWHDHCPHRHHLAP